MTKIENFKCAILSSFQTMWNYFCSENSILTRFFEDFLHLKSGSNFVLLIFSGRWKHKNPNSSLIKTAAFHIPKCLKPKNQSSSSQNQNQSSKVNKLKKSFHHASCLRSKSDNCLNRISNNNNYNKVNCTTSDGGQVDLASSDQSKRSFGQRVANVFASLVLNSNHSEVDPDLYSDCTSDKNLHHRVHLQRSSLRLRPTYKKSSNNHQPTVKKATSLERNINHRITEAEEQARRTRSLERNHRHLVTIDSTCR